MTTKEAIQAMLDGKKVRVKTQDAQEYIYISDDGYIVDENNELIDFTNSRNWEIYKEPKPKRTVVIEKWLCYSQHRGFLPLEGDKDYFKTVSYAQVKLLGTYEVEL